jgi:hypothetical protein
VAAASAALAKSMNLVIGLPCHLSSCGRRFQIVKIGSSPKLTLSKL